MNLNTGKINLIEQTKPAKTTRKIPKIINLEDMNVDLLFNSDKNV